MKPSIILSITLVLAFTICTEVKSQFNFGDLNEQQCLYFENNNNRMLLQCINNNGVASAYFQMIAPGTSPAYYLIAIKFKGESRFFKYKFYNPSGNVLGKTQSGYLKFTTRNGNFVIGKAYGGSPSGAERQLIRTAEKYDCEEFVFQTGQVVDRYGNYVTNNSTPNNNYNSSPSPSGRSRASIQYDLNKAYDLLYDMERYRENTNSTVLKMQYDRMIINQKQRINELEAELRNATY